jgi:hypothetical protein
VALAVSVTGAAEVKARPATLKEPLELPALIATEVGAGTGVVALLLKVIFKPPGGAAVLSCTKTESWCIPFETASCDPKLSELIAGGGPTLMFATADVIPVADPVSWAFPCFTVLIVNVGDVN